MTIGTTEPQTIRFYSHTRGNHRVFSNFFPSPFHAGCEFWQTVEHYFQAQKFAGTALYLDIRDAESPAEAKRLGRLRGMRVDWDAVRDGVMLAGLRAKFSQCTALQNILLSTGDAFIIEAAKRDYYWGEGADGTGQNMLGRLLMQVRSELAAGDANDDAEQVYRDTAFMRYRATRAVIEGDE
jgi:ribA/ribD-fused uncharacterized protein